MKSELEWKEERNQFQTSTVSKFKSSHFISNVFSQSTLPAGIRIRQSNIHTPHHSITSSMDFQDIGEEFVVEDVETTIKSAIGSVLNDTMYTPTKINDWSNSIISSALKGLQSLNRPFKYVLTVIIMQKNGAGLTSVASTFWDTTKDGLCKVTWENTTMHCIVTVYGLAVNVDGPTEMD